jgi:hypothetical protein
VANRDPPKEIKDFAEFVVFDMLIPGKMGTEAGSLNNQSIVVTAMLALLERQHVVIPEITC